MLFKVGNTDYTTKIRQGTYTVNAYDVYKEWQDANALIHRSVIATRIQGQFTMYFGNQTDYESFINTLSFAKYQGGFYKVGLMINNKMTFYGSTEVFLEFKPTRQQKVIGEAWYPELVVQVQGR